MMAEGKYAFAAAKLAQLGDRHIAPLTKFVNDIAKDKGYNQSGPIPEVPYFDPDDGGVDARVLFLMDTPIVKADVGLDSSGLISMENPDDTASYILQTHSDLNVPRKLCAYWNIVSYPTAERPSTPAERFHSAKYTKQLLTKFDNLERIVLMGNKAQEGWAAQMPRGYIGIKPDPVFLPSRATNNKPRLTRPYRVLMERIAYELC